MSIFIVAGNSEGTCPKKYLFGRCLLRWKAGSLLSKSVAAFLHFSQISEKTLSQRILAKVPVVKANTCC